MPKTVPNQRVIRVHRERASSDFLGIKNERWMAASRILGATALRLYLYLALDLSRGEAHPDEGEFLDLVKLPFSELLAMVNRGEISDGKTAIAALQAEHILAGE